MIDEINEAAKNLRDKDAGWVTRRDGAQLLGEVAVAALTVLYDHRDEMDVDVRRTIEKALGEASAVLQGIKPQARAAEPVPLEKLVQFCAKPGSREVNATDGGQYEILVSLREDRKQTVYVTPFKRKDGVDLIRVFTYCGKVTRETMEWALKANMKLTHGALAVKHVDDEERFVLVNCFYASEVTQVEFKASVKEIAFYGDWVEKKLTGLDDF